MDNDPDWLQVWDQFLSYREEIREGDTCKDTYIRYVYFLDELLFKIKKRFWKQVEDVHLWYILLDGIKSNADLERERPKTSEKIWTETELSRYFSQVSRMAKFYGQYQTLIWELADTRLSICKIDPDTNATEYVDQLERESIDVRAFMEKPGRLIPSECNMDFDLTLPTTHENFKKIRTSNLSAEGFRNYSLRLRAGVEGEIRKLKNLTEGEILKKADSWAKDAVLIRGEGLKEAEKKLEELNMPVQNLLMILNEADANLLNLKDLDPQRKLPLGYTKCLSALEKFIKDKETYKEQRDREQESLGLGYVAPEKTPEQQNDPSHDCSPAADFKAYLVCSDI
ncbi:hypothetical protein EMPG_17040 [Blastomyces silverae]|uniref:Uncharacterized protein n=1 Tax=Blastomyces silverae TaxID=2060906 RepID=A0A0H1B7W5_9EURO|nr:hypothetical protein EMPG_17040 [Blastomyces silverae]